MSTSTNNARMVDNERSNEWLQARRGERFSIRIPA